MKFPHRTFLVGTALTAALLLSACEKTTVVEVSTVPTTVVNETTTLPSGTPSELLSQLRGLAYSLSSAIVDGGAQSKYVMAQLDSLWAAAKAQLPRTEFVEEIGNQMELMHVAVDRKRPADADKAALRMQSLIDIELPELDSTSTS